MESLRRWWQQFKETWNGLSVGRRFGLVFLVVFSLAVIIGVGWWASRPDYQMLYSDLAAEDAGAITAKLDSLGVPYRVAGGGSTILVPAERVQKLKIDLAVEGLPARGGKGYELFDGNSLGSTPFSQHINHVRAMQGEISKTLTQIDPIVAARVHISRPEPSPFIRDQKPVTASVVLRLKPGTTLPRNVAAGIAVIVARSVEGLTPEQVAISDASGHLLSEPNNGDTGAVGSQLEYRRSVERHLAAKAEEMLERVLGPGRAVVRVTADVNFQRLKEKRETYNPEGRVVISEKSTTLKSVAGGAPARGTGGAAGAASNLPSGRGAATTPSSNSSTNQEETSENSYAVSKTTQEVEDKLGNIERLTVAALVDLSGGGAEGAPARPALTVNDASELIKQAVGYKVDRDEIKVNDVRLAPPEDVPLPDDSVDRREFFRSLADVIRNASLGVAAIVAVIVAWMALRPLRPAPTPTPEATPERTEVIDRVTATARREPETLARALKLLLDRDKTPSRAAA